MHRISRRMVAVVVVIGAIAAGGAAFTAGNTVPAQVIGYGSAAVTGATVDTIHDTLTGDGAAITSVQLTMHSALPTSAIVTAGYSDETAQDACTTSDQTVYTCAVTHGLGGNNGTGVAEPTGSELVSNASNFSVSVTQ
ncbi:MAG: hypothetical protein WAU75_22360 [Solirubrobacteraceae bacterium]